MVLGVSRLRLWPRGKFVEAMAIAPELRAQPESEIKHWIAERGDVLFEAEGEIFGGFPGFAERGGRLERARLRVTQRYLLVNEREPTGFGIPISLIEGIVLTPLSPWDELGLQVLYRHGDLSRLFAIRFRRGLGSRIGRRAERMRETLIYAGLPPALADRTLPEPAFHISWNEASRFESENVIWTGRASAPLRVGLPVVPSEVWLTTRSLIWGSPEGDGINRLPLPLLIDVLGAQCADRHRTPVVYIGIGDETTGRYEIPFIFDQLADADRNLRERGAFLVGLRSRGVPFGVPARLIQPWRKPYRQSATLVPVDSEAPAAPAASTEVAAAHTSSAEPAPSPAESVVSVTPATVAETTATATLDVVEAPGRNGAAAEPAAPSEEDVAVATPEQVESPDEVITEHSSLEAAAAEPAEIEGTVQEVETQEEAPAPNVPTEVAEAWETVRAYEAAAIAVFAESRDANSAVHLVPPTAAQQAAALTALHLLARMGALTEEEAERRSTRIVALGEAAVRLRSLIELRDAGHLTEEELAAKRGAIFRHLTSVISGT